MDFVAFCVEMVACCLVEMLVGNISFMFRKSFLKGPFTFTYVLNRTNITFNTLNDVPILATNLPV